MVTPLTPDDPAELGRYRLAGRLGAGGQGVVYLANSPEGEQVAVKLLSTGDRQTRARLARELGALESIASFCTARVLDASVDGPRPYVVSEFVEGPSLAERVDDRGPLRGGDLERLAVGTATALAAIHAAGVVHRDFKPANVLLGPDGPRVVDFGIARAEGAATMTSGLIGTPAYLSPEQIGGTVASSASDVFAWAATMLFAATGRSPFGADTVAAVLHRVLTTDPDLSSLPPRLGALIASCLSKDPSHRPAARELMVSLVNPNTPVQTTPPRTNPPPPGAPGRLPGGPSDGTPLTGGAPQGRTDPRGAATGTHASGGGRSRGLLVGAVAAVVALGAAGGVYLWANGSTPSGDVRALTSTTAASAVRTPAPASPTGATTGRSATDPANDPGNDPGNDPAADQPSSGPATGESDGHGLKIPASFAGRWAGHTTSTNPLDGDGAENSVTLKAGAGSAGWTEDGCEGTITLTKSEGDELTFSLAVSRGGCIEGTVWLARHGETLGYTWRDSPGLQLVTQTGDLRKS
jgi:hypothetical protein